MGRRLLIVLLEGASPAHLDAAVLDHAGEAAKIYVVVPAHVGPLEWLATDEGRAQSEAGARVLEAEWLLADSGEVAGEAGEPDPVLAVADALRHFPADEIVLVGDGALDATLLASLRSLGPPVAWVGLSPRRATRRGQVRGLVSSLVSGRSAATPIVAFIAANLAFLLLALTASLVVLLVVWLTGIL